MSESVEETIETFCITADNDGYGTVRFIVGDDEVTMTFHYGTAAIIANALIRAAKEAALDAEQSDRLSGKYGDSGDNDD